MSAHLALFIRSLGGGGGAERALLNLGVELARRGHRVDLVLARAEGPFLRDVPASLRLVDLEWRSTPAQLAAALRALARAARCDPAGGRRIARAFVSGRPPVVLGSLPALVRYLREERPQALLSALCHSNVTAICARRLAGSDARVVVSERNTLSARVAHDRRLRALPDLVRHFYPQADAVAAVSEGVAADLVRVAGLSRSAVHTTYNPVVTPELAREAGAPLDDPWFRPGEPPVVLGAGKLKPQKDFATLLEAFARVRRARRARLVILGRGPERRRLEARARRLGVAGDVAFPGFVANPFCYMARAAAFALSSRWEGLPGVLIQAMACGTPVVSTDCPSGPAEILDKGSLGALVPVGDARALAKALCDLLAAPPDPEPLRARAGMFSARRSADRYLALLLGRTARA